MSRLYWDSQFLSPSFLVTSMDHNSLKRSRSTESLERQFKRSKPFQIESVDSPISGASEPSPITTTTPAAAFSNITLYPINHVHQQQQEQQLQQHHTFLKPISISTKTSDNSFLSPQAALGAEAAAAAAAAAAVTPLTTDYANINGILYSAHVERFGDPETRESWWQQNEDIEMGEEEAEEQDTISNNEYNSVNSVLRQAFLARHQR